MARGAAEGNPLGLLFQGFSLPAEIERKGAIYPADTASLAISLRRPF